MSREEIERAITDAKNSVEMEGYTVPQETVELSRKVLQGDMSYEEFLRTVLSELEVA
jgi:hypothetical protein